MSNRTILSTLRPCLRLFSTSNVALQTLSVNGKTYPVSDKTNVTSSILNLTDRAVYLKPSHPVGILRSVIEDKLNDPHHSFEIYNDFKPAVTVHENFDSLGFPEDHPGRSKSDTYYLNDCHLLRTHTSAHELECFKNINGFVPGHVGKTDKPGFLISADVYRRDEIDRTHYPVFHQMEGGRVWKREPDNQHLLKIKEDLERLEKTLADDPVKLVVEDNVSLEGNPKQEYMTMEEVDLCSRHLKRSLELVVLEVFKRKLASMGNVKGEELKVRWIQAYFPWTAPSWEIEVFWQNNWLELCGCGLIREDVLLKAGYEQNQNIGWAFGLGLDRIAMLLFEIPDIRLFWTLDERFHSQFKEGTINKFKPYSKYPGTIRDVAFWLPTDKNFDIIHENDLMEIVRNVAGDLVECVKLIDSFTHPKTGRKSLCYRINYQSMDRNVTNEEVNELQDKVRDTLVKLYGVELR
ncbi:phenylalanine--tRNA ligase [Kluyveromyces lactis]|uniref:Phenylalanine--tRNA ligase, mitochondrial n=1 Tax=Kluyveromyces lactis (strain ATCC 8585 / CBS 2359 / DSM 70799 / NBRC 1267 / NRRL Y-1140 / WM37) TaxID=284590 RepID=Q6CVG7_KLULA|nr:uncharacterized protein KLLA0_B12177g [Kluyveromyces lactis]CAH02465.1 KLLA0B12177p [Kluyveromyces lactis]|eukprot:XP_452072.1 uncharacterized protein KLLA0_B12177g [Kluyveromyces lactis]